MSSLIPTGLLGRLPDSLWPDTITIQAVSLDPDSNDETAPAFSAVAGQSAIPARRVALGIPSDPDLMAMYPSATHKFLTRQYIPDITPHMNIVDQNGIVYKVINAQSPGEDPFSRIIVEQLA
jgi:hypothetical protein